MDIAEWEVLVSAIGALFAALATGGIFIAARQLRIEAWDKAQKIFTDPSFRDARANVFESLRQGTKPSDKDAFEVCRRMDELGRIVPFLTYRLGRADKKALYVWDDPIGKAWHALEAFVVEERNKTGWMTKWDAFQRIGKKAYDRLEKRGRLRGGQHVLEMKTEMNAERSITDAHAYQSLTSLIIHAEQIRWTRLNTFLVVCSFFVAAWVGVLVGAPTSIAVPVKRTILILLCVPGALFAPFWSVLGWRSSKFLNAFHDEAYRMEDEKSFQSKAKPFHGGEGIREGAKKGIQRATTSQWLVTFMPVIFATLFMALGVLSLFLL